MRVDEIESARFRCDDGLPTCRVAMLERIKGRQRIEARVSLPERANRRSRQEHARGRKSNGFRHRQVEFGGAPVLVGSAWIATYDVKHARDIDSNRLRYDDGRSERCRAADRKTQQGCRVADSAAAALDARVHMRQVGQATKTVAALLTESQFGSTDCRIPRFWDLYNLAQS